MITPILETERVLLRPLQVSDAETVYINWTSDPEVARFMRWSAHQSVDEALVWLTDVESNMASEKRYDWGFVYKEHDELFGSGGLIYNEDSGLFELGYGMMQNYWGLGLATELSKAMLTFATEVLGERKIFACHAKENPASGQVLEKLGFVYQRDCAYSSFDGERVFESREYLLVV